MPKWWPWGRSARQAAPVEPAAPAAAAAAQPTWQRLTPVQRTVGDIEPTAQFAGFTESLTTSQNPGFTRPVALLTADHAGLPVLDAVPVHADVPPAVPAAGRSRSWAPRLPSVQRAHVGMTAPVQRLTEHRPPETEVFPVEHAGTESAREMVEASDVDDRRPLDAVPADSAPADSAPADSAPADSVPAESVPMAAAEITEADVPSGQPPSTAPDPAPAGPVTIADPAPTRSSATVQRINTGDAPSTALPVVQTVSSSPASAEQRKIPELRRIAAVQRTASARPLPTLRTVDIPAPTAPTVDSGTPAVVTTDGSVPPDPVAARPADPDVSDVPVETPHDMAPAPDETPPTPPSPPAVTIPGAAPAPHHDDTAGVPMQRDMSPVPLSPSLPADRDDHPPTRTEFTPTVAAEPPAQTMTPPPGPAALPRPSATTPAPAPAVQRIEASPALPVQRLDTSPPPHPPSRTASGTENHDPAPQLARSLTFEAHHEAAREASAPVIAATPERTDVHVALTPVHAEPRHTAPDTGPPDPVVAQRLTLPTVDPPAAHHPSAPARPVVQRAVHNRRLVVLPPIRTDTERPPITGPSAATESTTVGSSPQPVGLQRMFAAAGPASSTPQAAGRPRRSEPGLSPESAVEERSFAFHEPAHDYDLHTNTITFDTAYVQRETDEATPPPEAAPEPAAESAGPAVIAAAPAAAAAAGAAAPTGPNVDELLNKLYDPLVARLRAELWLDRERAGMLMDLGR